MYYRICDNCGAVLDVGEKCDCSISETNENKPTAKRTSICQDKFNFRNVKKEGINAYINTQIQS